MPGPLANLVLERANAPGTAATFNLGGAPSGWVGFVAAIGNGATAYYFISDGVQAEWGHGTVTAGALNSLARNVIGNTQGTTQRLNFTGAVDVWCEVPAERTPLFDAANTMLPMGGRRLAGLGAAAAGSDAARLDQVGWRVLANTVFDSQQAAVVFSLPPLERYRLEWSNLTPVAPGGLYLRYSLDGGNTFRAGATDYGNAGTVARGGAVAALPEQGSFIVLSPYEHQGASFGFWEFFGNGVRPGIGQTWGIATSGQTYHASMGAWSGVTGLATHVLLGFFNQNCALGRVRLLGAHV